MISQNLRLGIFSCQLKDYIRTPFIEKFNDYISVKGDDNSPSICVQKGKVLPLHSCECGWQYDCFGSNQWRATYCDGKRGIFTLSNRGEFDTIDAFVSSENSWYVLPAIQFAMLLALAKVGVGLHGVTIVCKDKAIILSAPSKTGKTTLANMLSRKFDATIINGDFALLSVGMSNGVFFEPTPFCGSSCCCVNRRVKIDRIVFLEQSSVNRWRNVTGREGILRLTNNTFIPGWDTERSAFIRNNLVDIVNSVSLSVFSFAPTDEAASLFYSIVTK